MSKNNKLLKESTIRRFMKLASIEPLTENFIDEKEEIEEMAYVPGKAHEDEPPMEPEAELPMEPEEGEGELPDDLDGEAGTVSKEKLVSAVEVAVAEIADVLNASFGELTGQSFGVEKGDDEEGLEEPAMEPEMDLGPPTDDEEELALEQEEVVEAAHKDDEEDLKEEAEEELKEEEEELDEDSRLDEITNELTKRVLNKILNENKKEKEAGAKDVEEQKLDADAISDKIIERVFSSLKKNK